MLKSEYVLNNDVCLIPRLYGIATSCSIIVPVAASLNAEEENSLHVSGYVTLKLMRKYQKEDSEKQFSLSRG